MKLARCFGGGGLKMPAMASWYVMACTRREFLAASASASLILCRGKVHVPSSKCDAAMMTAQVRLSSRQSAQLSVQSFLLHYIHAVPCWKRKERQPIYNVELTVLSEP